MVNFFILSMGFAVHTILSLGVLVCCCGLLFLGFGLVDLLLAA